MKNKNKKTTLKQKLKRRLFKKSRFLKGFSKRAFRLFFRFKFGALKLELNIK